MKEATIREMAAAFNVTERCLQALIASRKVPVVSYRKTHDRGFCGGMSRVYRVTDVLKELGQKAADPLPPDAAMPPQVTIKEAAAYFRVSYRVVYGRVVAARLPVVGSRRTVQADGMKAAVREGLYDRDALIQVVNTKVMELRATTLAADRFEDWYEDLFGRPPLANVDYAKVDQKFKEGHL